MSDEQALIPSEQRTIIFYGDEIKGVRVTRTPSGKAELYVPLRPLCDYLGISYTGQRERIERDPVLSKKLQTVQVATDGGPQVMQCLSLDYLNGWLFGINANRVKESVRDRLIRYQEECYVVLRDAFQEPTGPDALTQVEQLGHALITLAREQREFDRRLDSTQDELEDVKRRVVVLEDRLSPGASITEEQASQISQAVKAVAMELSRQSGRNEYGGVYGELYRKFSITSYKLLPAASFQEAMNWLNSWYGGITDKEIPF